MQVVAESRSDETFVALCLLTVTGASLLTQRLGFSDTAGAFAAGTPRSHVLRLVHWLFNRLCRH